MEGEAQGVRPGGATITPDTRWMTYREMAEFLGLKEESARRRAQREGWPRQLGNDGRTRVGVPGDAVAPGAPPTQGTDAGDGHPGEIAALREALARERERADRAEERADRAEAAAALVPELRERLGRAEGEAEGLKHGMEHMQDLAAQAKREAAEAHTHCIAAIRRAEEADRVAQDAMGEVERLRGRGLLARLLNRP